MRYYANPSTEKVRDAMIAGLLGYIATPAQGNRRIPGVTWCADNGCFGKGYPGEAAWYAWLASATNTDVAVHCAFAVAPDVVGDAGATLERSAPWLPEIRALGYRAAFVAQNGQESLPVPWTDFDVLFLGGSPECLPCGYIRPAGDRKRKRCPGCHSRLTEWKLGRAARGLVAEAKELGKAVHMGRVNSLRRYRYACLIGCDSADGTFIAKGPDVNLPKALGWADRSASSLRGLFDVSTLR